MIGMIVIICEKQMFITCECVRQMNYMRLLLCIVRDYVYVPPRTRWGVGAFLQHIS